MEIMQDEQRHRLSAEAKISFLFEKWQYHDNLMHRRDAAFWTVEVAFLGLLATIVALDINYVPRTPFFLFTGAILLLSLKTRTQGRAHRTARNAYNPQIVALLEAAELIPKDRFNKPGWDPTAFDHPTNRWHLSVSALSKGDGIAPAWVDSWFAVIVTTIVNIVLVWLLTGAR